MALLERVATLVRANLNDLVDKAEHPEKMIKQVILDMQNQLLQVKTQVAIAIADQHLLDKKTKRKRRQSRGVDAQGRTLRRQETGRPGARRPATSGKLSRPERRLRRAGDRSEGPGGKSENRATPTGAETDRGPGQGRPADRPASPRPGRQAKPATPKWPPATVPAPTPSTA